MDPFRTAVIIGALATVAFYPASYSQDVYRGLPPRPKKKFFLQQDLPARRWIVSFNPLGLAEPPLAIGAGIGYRLNPQWELWSETSLIRNGILQAIADVHGIRQTLQLKRFFNKGIGHNLFGANLFVAAEIRYKSFYYNDTANFYNATTHDTLQDRPYHAHQYFWGAALQVGGRWKMTRSGRFQVEITAGLGVKNKIIDRDGIGKGYGITNRSIDLNAWDIMATPGVNVYFPGSARIIYTIGKRIL